jgi:hypothetical protein
MPGVVLPRGVFTSAERRAFPEINSDFLRSREPNYNDISKVVHAMHHHGSKETTQLFLTRQMTAIATLVPIRPFPYRLIGEYEASLVKDSKSPDLGLRTTTLYALGQVDTPIAKSAVAELLSETDIHLTASARRKLTLFARSR